MSENFQYSLDDADCMDDEDICTAPELEQYFKHKYKIHDETSVTDDDNYVLSLAKDDSLTCLVAGLSDGSVRTFDISSEKGLYIMPPQLNTKNTSVNICGVRFLDETPNLLLVGTTNGIVRLIDLRTQCEVSRFENNTIVRHEPKLICCFDCNSDSTLLCMGTNEYQTNSYMLFYDIRSTRQLFRYEESHQEDVTSLRFHPSHRHLICSGSTDMLINIFDVTKKSEDKSLLATINAEGSVSKLNWHTSPKNKDIISCITHTNDFKTYTFGGDLIAEFDRLQITEIIKRKNEANCNLIDCHNTSSNEIVLLTGSNFNNGEIMRSCTFEKDKLVPYANFEMNGQIVRESLLDAKTNVLITGGEAGIVTLWTPLSWQPASVDSSSSSSKLKMKTEKSHKVKPY